MIENIFQASPVEIDTRIAAIMFRRVEISQGLLRAQYILDNKRVQYILDSKRVPDTEIDKALATIKSLNAELDGLITERAELHDEFNGRGGWNRYYLVTNTNGHVHTSTECATCFDGTDFGWLIQFSGTEQDEMGKLSGEAACAVCFPNLPTEVMQAKRDARVDTTERIAAREAQAAATAAKKAKAAGNAITDVDGSPLRGEYGVIKTLHTARIDALRALEQAGLDEIYADQADEPARVSRLHRLAADEYEMAEKLIKAIAAKQGRTVLDVDAELAAKANKKLAPARKDEAARKAAGKTAEEWYRK